MCVGPQEEGSGEDEGGGEGGERGKEEENLK